jgi:anaerobic selenocysteine-containing dehydrogenase
MRSRRDFIKLVAAGSAAASLGRSGRALAATTAKSAPAKHTPTGKPVAARSAALETELNKQKKSTADTLKTLRDHELSPAAPLAFVFKALKPRKGGHTS